MHARYGRHALPSQGCWVARFTAHPKHELMNPSGGSPAAITRPTPVTTTRTITTSHDDNDDDYGLLLSMQTSLPAFTAFRALS